MDNRQALGYMLLACKDLELGKETIKKIKGAMYLQFDMKTKEEAEELGNEWYNELLD